MLRHACSQTQSSRQEESPPLQPSLAECSKGITVSDLDLTPMPWEDTPAGKHALPGLPAPSGGRSGKAAEEALFQV